jgi:hypothetical protein
MLALPWLEGGFNLSGCGHWQLIEINRLGFSDPLVDQAHFLVLVANGWYLFETTSYVSLLVSLMKT